MRREKSLVRFSKDGVISRLETRLDVPNQISAHLSKDEGVLLGPEKIYDRFFIIWNDIPSSISFR